MKAKGMGGTLTGATLALSLGLVSGCAGLAGTIGSRIAASTTTNNTSTIGTTTGTTTTSSTSGEAAIAPALTDLQEISALSQISALGGAGGASGLVSSSPLTSSAPYMVLSVATQSMTAQQIQQFNSQSGWRNGNTFWSFVAASGWFDLTGSGGGFLGTETVKDASGDILETDPMEMDYERNSTSTSTSTSNDWSGTDTLTETVATSSLRPAGTYVHVNQSDNTSDASNDMIDLATNSVTFTPIGGGSAIQTQTIRDEFQSADHTTDNATETSTGTLPGGLAFSATHAMDMDPATYSFAVDATLDLTDGHQVKTHMDMTGGSDPTTHGPASFDPSCVMDVTLLKADGSTELSMALDQFTLDPVSQSVQTTGTIEDSTGKQVATYTGNFSISKSTWTGVATFDDQSTQSIDLSAMAVIINSNQ